MKTVIHLLNTGSFSGAENVVITLIKRMRKVYKGEYRFFYVSLQGGISERLKEEGIPFLPVDKLSVFNIRKIVKNNKVDLIHAHDFTASILSSISLVDIPIISHLHCNPLWMKKYNMKSIAYYISSFRYSHILTVSNAIENEYILAKKIKKKVCNIGNPVDIKLIKEKAEKNRCENSDIIFLGRMSDVKEPLRFINIVNQVVKNRGSISAIMIGSGELENKCKDRINELGLEKHVEMLGFLNNPYPHLKCSKVMCITSKYEGFGMMAVEALALGIPVVSTYVGGLKEIINESCGYFCTTDQQFVEMIEKVLSNDKLRRELSIGALQRVKEISDLEAYSSRIFEIYSDAIKTIKRGNEI